VRDADRVIGILEAEGKGSPALVINRLNPAMVKNHDMLSAEDVLDLLAIQLIGIVPEDENVIIGTNKGAPVVLEPKSRAGQAFRNVACRLMGQDVPFMDLDHQSGLWDKISRLAGRK
jgi:septum site-determining protein MinD